MVYAVGFIVAVAVAFFAFCVWRERRMIEEQQYRRFVAGMQRVQREGWQPSDVQEGA